jgi:hypothetical protein
MEIEEDKKYKTRDGRDVEILSLDEKYHRAIGLIGDDTKYRSLTIWDIRNREMLWSEDQSTAYLLNLVEVEEDWRIAVRHFESGGEPILLEMQGIICLVEWLSEDSTAYLLARLEIIDQGLCEILVHRNNVSIPTLEDCNKFILKK